LRSPQTTNHRQKQNCSPKHTRTRKPKARHNNLPDLPTYLPTHPVLSFSLPTYQPFFFWLYQCFFFSFGDISPNFDLKNMISTYTKDFSWKKNDLNSPDFEGKIKSKSPDFNDEYQ
jgi:hypothetical protein